ncbi:hypothetical protein TNCV_2426711 [Trichonephila clavipes]|nr:hypothetical protein TNCV_2426711 [Trichonephila clavipes]
MITPLPACPVLETTTTTFNTIPTTSQDANQTSKPLKSQRTKQALCKTSLTRKTNESQLNNGEGRWTTTTHGQRFVLPVLPDRPF